MNFKKYVLSAAIGICAISACKKHENPGPKPAEKTDVYVVGTLTTASNIHVAMYLKNDTMVRLTDTTAATASQATAIVINGKDVYVAGVTNDGANTNRIATYWKNGVATNVSDASTNAYVNAMAVIGNDVYMAGGIFDATSIKPVYWKNGVITYLPVRTTGFTTTVTGIAVNGTDVYVVGQTTSANLISTATYWKNNAINLLEDTTKVSVATAIAVNGADIYITGYVNSPTFPYVATYWKNGTATTLPISIPWAITFGGADLYTSGAQITGAFDPGTAIFSKNGVATKLTGAKSANSIAVDGNDVYICGTTTSGVNGIYWKNGVPDPYIPKAGTSVYYAQVAIGHH
jgi:hypothetical protein